MQAAITCLYIYIGDIITNMLIMNFDNWCTNFEATVSDSHKLHRHMFVQNNKQNINGQLERRLFDYTRVARSYFIHILYLEKWSIISFLCAPHYAYYNRLVTN